MWSHHHLRLWSWLRLCFLFVILDFHQIAADPDPWWNTDYQFRKRLEITNSSGSDSIVSGYAVKVDLDHATLVGAGNSLSSGNDLRVVHWNGSGFSELDRVTEEEWNLSSANVWFKTQSEIAISANDHNYYLYYGNNTATSPPENRSNIYLWYDNFSTNTIDNYIHGRHVEFTGVETSALYTYDETDQNLTIPNTIFSPAGIRIQSITGGNMLIACNVNSSANTVLRSAFAMGTRWTTSSNNYYGFFRFGNNQNSPGIEQDEGLTQEIGSPGSSQGNTYLDHALEHYIMFGSFKDTHRMWLDTTDTAISGNIASGSNNTHTTGNPFIQSTEVSGNIDNLLIREYMEPEPTLSSNTEESLNDYKATGLHTFTSNVSVGEQNNVILRLDISTGTDETLTEITVTGNNTTDADVSGVSCYYTGTSFTFETSAPFGTENQSFSGGKVTFTGTRPLVNDSLVHFFIVYHIAGGATAGNIVDAMVSAGNILISGNAFPNNVKINPSGNRAISASSETLGSITTNHSTTGNVFQGEGNQEILRFDIPVTGTGSPLTLNSLTISSNNINNSDVTGVSCFYTGTSSTFATDTNFGLTDQNFSNGQVSFNSTLDFIGENSTHYLWVAYNISNLAIDGSTVDAYIEGANITIENVARTPSTNDPTGSRAIEIPTGNVSGQAPISIQHFANPGFTDFLSELVAIGNVQNIASNDGAYAGLWFNPFTLFNDFESQQLWLEMTYDLSGNGIKGKNIISLAFEAELYLVGNEGTGPATDPAEYEKIHDSKIQIYNNGTKAWEDLVDDWLTPTSSSWLTGTEAARWDETGDSNPGRPLTATKTSGWTNDYLDTNDYLKLRVWVDGKLNTTADGGGAIREDVNFNFDYAWIDYSYGTIFEQAAFRWADASEAPVANEDNSFEAATGQKLHLRVGIRSTRKDKGAHYLGVQYDEDPNFLTPELVTVSSANILFWDDSSHSEGDAVSGAKILSNSPTDGIYHEDNVPPVQTKTADLLYEEDFTLQATVNGNYYLRVVEVDGSGAFQGTLDVYTSDIQLQVSSPSDNVAAYDWAVDAVTPTFLADDTALEFTPGTNYLLAIRVDHGAATSNYDWQLQYQENPFTSPGSWTTVNAISPRWKATNTDRSTTTIDLTADAACAAGAGTEVDNTLSTTGNMELNFTASPNYSEFWYCIQPDSGTADNAYRFRLTNAGDASGMSFDIYPVAKNSTKEQVSFIWADDGELAIEPENGGGNVSVNQQVHLRVGLRGNHTTWSDNNLGIQIDGDNDGDFGTGSHDLLIVGGTNLQYWDDADHNDSETLSGTKLLTGATGDGLYHEDKDQASATTKNADVLYEEDFTIQATVAGNYYMRVVTVDDNGDNPVALDTYSSNISLTAIASSLSQQCYRWAADAASPVFSSDNTTLDFTVGTYYILAVQMENGGLTETPTWKLQFQKINGTPGAWTDVTTTSTHWKAVNGIYGVDSDVIGSGNFVCNSGNASTGGYSADSGVYSESGSSSDSLGANAYSEYWFVMEPTSESNNNTYRFRITDNGSASKFIYNVYPQAAKVYTEQVSYRWADSNEAALFSGNTAANVSVDQQLHLRVGIRSNNGNLAAHNLALQAASDSGFNDAWTVTLNSGNISSWDDTGNSEGAAVSGAKILDSNNQNGIYHEDEDQPSTQTKTADLIYEEDFTVSSNVAGTYYLRVVSVDNSGNNPTTMTYTNAIQLISSVPSITQAAFEWTTDATTPDFTAADNIVLKYKPANTYILAFRFDNSGVATPNNDWLLEYQKDPFGTPGQWTAVTSSSADWRMVDGSAGADQDSITVAAGGNAITYSGNLTNQNGIYAENNDTGARAVLSGNSFTEFWYAVQAQDRTNLHTYRFRLTNSGSTTGIQYDQYGQSDRLRSRRGIIFFGSGTSH